MTSSKKIKSNTFPLIIDENRSTILAAICAIAVYHPSFIGVMDQVFGIEAEEIKSFLEEIDDKVHEQGWCKAPDCLRDK